ncbi:hypothetical protein [Pseudorhodobacter sp.]|uniref:hypothetical protein n=1 Tax=Pseudorhodobacter sp. TaxID=1934400 RepID=UPI002649FA8F|nr:hypothetical protein [Pseudorhodobacter sp.]MDN5789069.1 hypothetical protein [Pseudorhodobacter sp.]
MTDVLEYPYPLDLRWQHVQWLPILFNRFLTSRFGTMSDFDVRGAGMTLWAAAMQSDPPATLDDDDRVFAFHLRVPVERWLELRHRPIGALYGWVPVNCGGEQRITHPALLEALEIAVVAAKLRQRGTRGRKMWAPPDAGRRDR